MAYTFSEEQKMPKSGNEYRMLLRDGKVIGSVSLYASTPYPRLNDGMTSAEWNERTKAERDSAFALLLTQLNK